MKWLRVSVAWLLLQLVVAATPPAIVDDGEWIDLHLHADCAGEDYEQDHYEPDMALVFEALGDPLDPQVSVDRLEDDVPSQVEPFGLSKLVTNVGDGRALLDIVGPLVIDGLVEWTSVESPIRVTGIIEIASGGILIIREGVEVLFQDSSSGITNAGGYLSILGQSTNRVVLGPEGDHPWRGISFGQLSIPASFFEDEATQEF